jgi:hypothetical protein
MWVKWGVFFFKFYSMLYNFSHNNINKNCICIFWMYLNVGTNLYKLQIILNYI